MTKKIITISVSAILAIILIALLGYFFFGGEESETEPNKPSIFRSFFPFGGNNEPQNNPTQNTATSTTETPTQNYIQKLRKISSEPVAGAGTLDVKEGTIVRYIERATGHVYETELFSPNHHRMSNTTLPTVYEASWGNKNSSIAVRYLREDNETVDAYTLTFSGVSTTTEIVPTGVQLPRGIKDITTSEASLFYLITESGGSSGYTSNWNGANRKQVWSSPIKEFNSQFVNPRTVALTTKPHPTVPGVSYTVDTVTGQTKNVLRGIFGLSTLVNDDISKILYLEQISPLKFAVYDTKNRTEVTIGPATFPEKCVWSKKDRTIIYCAVPNQTLGRSSLTSWYQGTVSWKDSIWRYDTKNNTSSMILDLSLESGEAIDVIKPILSSNEQYLLFINKIDNSLWSFDLLK